MPEPSVDWKLDATNPPHITSNQGGGLQVQASFRIRYADAFKFTNDVMGLETVVGIGNPASVGPWRFPPEPRLMAISCDVVPFGLPQVGVPIPGPYQGLNAGEFWEWATASVTFGVPDGAIRETGIDDPPGMMQFDPGNPITMCTQEIEYSNEMLSVPTGGYLFVSDSKPVNYGLTTRIITAMLTLKFPHVPFLPWNKLRPFLGTVNKAPVMGCAAGQLMFEGCSTSQTAQSNGARDKSLTLKFQYRSVPWNKFFRPDNGQFELIHAVGSDELVFAETDHRLIFT